MLPRKEFYSSGQCRFDDFYEWGWPCKFREAVDWDYVDPSQNNPALCLEATSLQPFNLIEGTSILHLSNRIDIFLEKNYLSYNFQKLEVFYVVR